MTYRQIATISKCSEGAVSAELTAMKAEKAKNQAPALITEASPTVIKEVGNSTIHEIDMPSGEIKLELDFAS
jgi:Fe-S cluster biogenesis protein NfuA